MERKTSMFHRLPSSLLVLLLLAAGACQFGRGDEDTDRAEGEGEAVPSLSQADPFSLMAMVHSPADGSAPTPDSPGPPVPTVKWDGRMQGGPFSYSSVRCIDPAPINDVSTNLTTFNGRIPRSSSPASIRLQPVQFNVTRGGDSGTLEGTINMVACGVSQGRFSRVADGAEVADADRDRITFSWRASYKRTVVADSPSPNASEVGWVGVFSIREGTGRYKGITGSGSISGNFVCLQGGGCSGPDYTDGQVVMAGTYKPAGGIPAESPPA